MRLLLLTWLLVAVLVLPGLGKDFCAVRVRVIGPSGTTISVPVQLIGPNGQVTQTAMSTNGEVEFCDLGFGEHTIHVGDDSCGSVTIHRVRLVFGISQRFDAVLNYCLTGADALMIPPSCLAYFRVSSEGSKKLSSATAVIRGNPRTFEADSYGRLFLTVPNGTAGDFTISAPGYADKTVQVSCRSYETIENAVQLIPK
jgi:hypothetical protein